MSRGYFATEDIEICRRVFDDICATGHITSDYERVELASQIIYFYQHGVTIEDSLQQLVLSMAERQRPM